MNPSPHYKVTSVSYNNTSNVKSDCFQLQEVFDGDQDWSLLLNYRRQMTFHQVQLPTLSPLSTLADEKKKLFYVTALY